MVVDFYWLIKCDSVTIFSIFISGRVTMLIHIPQSLFLSQYIGMYSVLLSVILLNVTYGVIYYIQASKLLANTASGIWAK